MTTEMPPLELKFLTDDADLIELARLYWKLDQEEKVFPHHLKELATKFSVPANKIGYFPTRVTFVS